MEEIVYPPSLLRRIFSWKTKPAKGQLPVQGEIIKPVANDPSWTRLVDKNVPILGIRFSNFPDSLSDIEISAVGEEIVEKLSADTNSLIVPECIKAKKTGKLSLIITFDNSVLYETARSISIASIAELLENPRVHNPERIIEKFGIEIIVNPDRVVYAHLARSLQHRL